MKFRKFLYSLIGLWPIWLSTLCVGIIAQKAINPDEPSPIIGTILLFLVLALLGWFAWALVWTCLKTGYHLTRKLLAQKL